MRCRSLLVICFAMFGTAWFALADEIDLEPLIPAESPGVSTHAETLEADTGDIAEDAEAENLPPAPPPPSQSSSFGTSIRIEGLEIEQADDAEKSEDEAASHPAWVASYLVDNDADFNLRTIETRFRPARRYPRATRLTTQPGGSITWIDGDPALDLPDRLYQFSIPIQLEANAERDFAIDYNVTPSWYTDGVNRRPEMFRLQGGANAYYRLNARDSLIGGFMYLNRDDIPALPVFGMLMDDEDNGRRLELVFPQPRLMWRLSPRNASSIWGVISGELGGGSWAIKRTDRTPDVLTYRDFRLTGGIEVRSHDGLRGMLEAGWVFGRRLESRTGLGEADLNDGFLARAWLEF